MTSKARDSKRWEEVGKKEKQSEANFVKSFGPRLSALGTTGLGVSSTKEAEDADHTRSSDSSSKSRSSQYELPALAVFGLLRAIDAFCW